VRRGVEEPEARIQVIVKKGNLGAQNDLVERADNCPEHNVNRRKKGKKKHESEW